METEADIRIDVTSRYDVEVPVFDLTGFSHRAVATTAEWTIDGVKVPAIPVLKTASNSEYFSKLTLRGRVERFARYTVFNKHSKHSTNFFNFFKYKRKYFIYNYGVITKGLSPGLLILELIQTKK